MKSIQLTPSHKSKLLEMCKALFPGWEFNEDFEYGQDIINNSLSKLEKGKRSEDIHWFEFCMTHLVNKLYYPDNVGKRNTREKVEYFFFQTFIDSIEGGPAGYDHPIDYLYAEFIKLNLKLKLEKNT